MTPILSKESSTYIVTVKGDETRVKAAIEEAKSVEVEDERSDLTYFFEQIEEVKPEDKILAVKIFFKELKTVTDNKNKLVSVLTVDNQKRFIRKVRGLYGKPEDLNSIYFETCGDNKG
jgi:hypothetical protein